MLLHILFPHSLTFLKFTFLRLNEAEGEELGAAGHPIIAGLVQRKLSPSCFASIRV